MQLSRKQPMQASQTETVDLNKIVVDIYIYTG